jgi:hypothetical protein
MMIPARYTRMSFHRNPYEWLLVETGDTVEEARRAVERSRQEWFRLRDERQWDESGWVEPSDPRLHRLIKIPVEGDRNEGSEYVSILDLQRLIEAETGLSIVSDYFTGAGAGLYPGQQPLGESLWRDLYILGKTGHFEWRLVGDGLVFHHTNWAWLAQRELPESSIRRWRAKLEDQERFTLDDIVQFAVELERRPRPRIRGVGRFAIPRDLLDAGVDAASGPFRGMLLLYRALTPDERAAARTPAGLPLSQLPPDKQRQITDYVLPPGVPRAGLQTPVPEFVAGTVFLVEAGSEEDTEAAPTQYEFRLKHPGDPILSEGEWTLTVRTPSRQPAGPT